MKIRGMMLVAAMVLSACGYTDTGSSGEDDAAKAAIADPQVTTPKLLPDPIDCEVVLAVHSVGVVASARARPVPNDVAEECPSEFLNTDGTVLGKVTVRFEVADTLDGPVMDNDNTSFEGNTSFEAMNVPDNVCESGVAIDEGRDRGEFGGWLVIRVDVEGDMPNACSVGGGLLFVAFGNLPPA